jgi:selenocysteine lyase/cysteine desulfurase
MAHEHGAKIVVDGAQIVAHRAFSMEGDAPEESIDYFVFSAHKMYTPFGGGAIVGRTEEIQAHAPRFWGGGTVLVVSDDWVEYKNAPELWEAGSPNYLSVVGLGKAIDVLREVGFDAIAEHEQRLNRKLIDGLVTQPNIIVYGDTEQIDDKVGVVTFNYSDVNTMVLALRLAASYGIATRRGAFCAHPYVWRLTGVTKEEIEGFANCTDVNTMGMVRVSFGIYNTEEEVDRFLEILPEAVERAKEDMKHYIRCDPQY